MISIENPLNILKILNIWKIERIFLQDCNKNQKYFSFKIKQLNEIKSFYSINFCDLYLNNLDRRLFDRFFQSLLYSY